MHDLQQIGQEMLPDQMALAHASAHGTRYGLQTVPEGPVGRWSRHTCASANTSLNAQLTVQKPPLPALPMNVQAHASHGVFVRHSVPWSDNARTSASSYEVGAHAEPLFDADSEGGFPALVQTRPTGGVKNIVRNT